MKCPKYWSFSFSISPSGEYLGLISFRTDWLDLLAVQRTLKSLLQNHNLKALLLQCSAFSMVLIPVAADCWENCASLLSHSGVSDCGTLDHSLPGSSVHGILQARILEWAARFSSRGSFQPRD